jgi:translation initiation factor IF-3
MLASIHFFYCLFYYMDLKRIFWPINAEVSVISKNELMINEEIRDKEVRLIDADGTMIGITAVKEAQKLANSKNLDLVKIAPQGVPPVCKIMDYGKYMFELAKKEKEARKNQKIISIKEVRVSPSIEDHDFEFKVKNAYKFLKDGDKVKVSVKFRGREMHYTSIGNEILDKFAEAVKDVGSVEKRPKLEGKSMIMILNPKQ